MATRRYPLTHEDWLDQGAVVVFDCQGSRICNVPIGSLVASGDLNWSYVLYCVLACVENEGFLARRGQRTAVDLQSPVEAGEYTFLKQSNLEESLDLRIGPQGSRKGRPAELRSGGSASTVSDSARSSTDQADLKLRVAARDGRCLISDSEFEQCVACHIVPYSRQDILESILGVPGAFPFGTYMGLLLDANIHKRYDAHAISIYPRNSEEYVIHVFHDPYRVLAQLHGKSFTSQRFRSPPNGWPRRELLLWHHQQCVLQHYRGYAHGVSPRDLYNPTS